MLGRQVGSSLLRLPIYARLPIRSHPLRTTSDLATRLLASESLRHYATPGRPRKAVGEPSKPVKRAVQRAAKTTSNDEPAKKKVQANKTKAAAKKKAKPAPKKRVKKELTEKQKETLKVKTEKAKIKDLKAAALSPPSRGTKITAFNIYVKDKMAGNKTGSATASVMKTVASDFKQLAPAELEHYNHIAAQTSETTQAEYKRWVQSHTPEQIQLANNARARLRSDKLKVRGGRKYSPIQDERHVKRPLTAYLQFSVNRQATGDFRNIPVTERGKLIAQEWKALSEGEKKKYKDLSSQDEKRYATEYTDTYGHPPQAAAAAA